MPTPKKIRNQTFDLRHGVRKPTVTSTRSYGFNPETILEKLDANNRAVRKLIREAEAEVQAQVASQPLVVQEDPRKQVERKRAGEGVYDDKTAVVMNLEKIKASGKKETDLILKATIETLKDAESMFKEEELVAQNIVVDLTKMMDELKAQIDKIEPEKLQRFEEYRKEFQYFQTAWSNAQKAIKSAEQKRLLLLQKWEEKMAQKDDMEDQIRQKYNIDVYEEEVESRTAELWAEFGGAEPSEEEFLQSAGFSDEIEVENEDGTKSKVSYKDISTNKGSSLINDSLRARLRELRGILTEHFQIPLEAINNLTIYMKGYGLTASLSTSPSYNVLSQEGFEVLKKSFPEVYTQMEKYISVVKPADSFKMLNTKIPEISQYFVQIQTKYENISDTFEQALKKTEGVKKEGMLGDIARLAIKATIVKFTKFFKNVGALGKTLRNRLDKEVKALEQSAIQTRKELDKIHLEGSRKALNFKSQMAKAQSKKYSEMDKKLAPLAKK